MMFLIPYIRRILYAFSILLAIAVFVIIKHNISLQSLQYIRLAQTYAFLAIGFLYLSMLSSPLYGAFPKIPGKPLFNKARRGLGLSAFLFACLHIYFAFFKLLGGFRGLKFLSEKYLIAIIISTAAFVILIPMALTSYRTAVQALGKNWKRIHRFVYIAAILIPIHAMMLGSHFTNAQGSLGEVALFAWLLLLLLEELRLYRYLLKRFSGIYPWIYAILLVALFVAIFYFTVVSNTLNIHNHA